MRKLGIYLETTNSARMKLKLLPLRESRFPIQTSLRKNRTAFCRTCVSQWSQTRNIAEPRVFSKDGVNQSDSARSILLPRRSAID